MTDNLQAALDRVDKAFGAGAVMKMGDDSFRQVEAISSGSIALDQCLGIGGYPKGRIVEAFGPPSSGKSTLALHAAASVQREGGKVLYVDAEHALDPTYCRALGVDVDELLISQPDTGEQAWSIVDMLVESGEISLVVLDSIAAMIPRAELQGDPGDSHVGLSARLNSQAMRRISGRLHNTNCTAFLINQLRASIAPFGPSEITTGGKAIPFYASVRMDVRRSDAVKQGEERVGDLVKIKVVKNKVSPPHRHCTVEIAYGKGIYREAELLDLGVAHNIVDKRGAWYYFDGNQIGQGKPKAAAALESDPDTAQAIETLIREKL